MPRLGDRCGAPRAPRARLWCAAAAVACAILASLAAPALARAQVLARVEGPDAVAVDTAGDVFVHREDSRGRSFLTRFSPDGLVTAEIPLDRSAPAEPAQSRLAVDPGSGDVLLLTQLGRIVRFRPDTLDSSELVDLSLLEPSAVASVFDVGARTFGPLTLAFPVYGGLTARRRDARTLELFVTGADAGLAAYPFVVRVRVDLVTNAIQLRVVATIRSSGLGPSLEPRRGIGVGPDGTVVTALPLPPAPGIAPSAAGASGDALLSFGAGFPEDPAAAAPSFVPLGREGGPLDVDARGIAVDAAGDFYVATGAAGTAPCGPGDAGQVLLVSRGLDAIGCLALAGPVGATEDVAVAPSGAIVAVVPAPGFLVEVPSPVPFAAPVAVPVAAAAASERGGGCASAPGGSQGAASLAFPALAALGARRPRRERRDSLEDHVGARPVRGIPSARAERGLDGFATGRREESLREGRRVLRAEARGEGHSRHAEPAEERDAEHGGARTDFGALPHGTAASPRDGVGSETELEHVDLGGVARLLARIGDAGARGRSRIRTGPARRAPRYRGS